MHQAELMRLFKIVFQFKPANPLQFTPLSFLSIQSASYKTFDSIWLGNIFPFGKPVP